MTLQGLVYRQYNERLARIKEQIYNGPVADWAEYRYLCGLGHGLTLMLQDIDPYIKDPEGAEDDA
jgi:hypothetical protein